MADVTDPEKKRLQKYKQEILDQILGNQDENVSVVYFNPYLIMYIKDDRKIMVMRFDETR